MRRKSWMPWKKSALDEMASTCVPMWVELASGTCFSSDGLEWRSDTGNCHLRRQINLGDYAPKPLSLSGEEFPPAHHRTGHEFRVIN